MNRKINPYEIKKDLRGCESKLAWDALRYINILESRLQRAKTHVNSVYRAKPPTVDSIKIYAVEEIRKDAYNDLANDLVCEILHISEEDFTPGFVTWLIDKITREKITGIKDNTEDSEPPAQYKQIYDRFCKMEGVNK